MAFFSQKTGQYNYFATQLGDSSWHGKDVLDFGGNIGNMLRDSCSTIDEERYWCIDVDRGAIGRGKTTHPRSHWLFCRRQCFFINPRGRPGLALRGLKQRFVYIVAYSVFTNTVRANMLALFEQLQALLKVDGKFALTFIDTHYCSWPNDCPGNNLQWRLEHDNRDKPHIDTSNLTGQASRARRCVLVSGHDLYVETEATGTYPCDQQWSFHIFYTVQYMESLFPASTIVSPACNEMQHCCIIAAWPRADAGQDRDEERA